MGGGPDCDETGGIAGGSACLFFPLPRFSFPFFTTLRAFNKLHSVVPATSHLMSVLRLLAASDLDLSTSGPKAGRLSA
jgi:hypothetical protein